MYCNISPIKYIRHDSLSGIPKKKGKKSVKLGSDYLDWKIITSILSQIQYFFKTDMTRLLKMFWLLCKVLRMQPTHKVKSTCILFCHDPRRDIRFNLPLALVFCLFVHFSVCFLPNCSEAGGKVYRFITFLLDGIRLSKCFLV